MPGIFERENEQKKHRGCLRKDSNLIYIYKIRFDCAVLPCEKGKMMCGWALSHGPSHVDTLLMVGSFILVPWRSALIWNEEKHIFHSIYRFIISIINGCDSPHNFTHILQEYIRCTYRMCPTFNARPPPLLTKFRIIKYHLCLRLRNTSFFPINTQNYMALI